MISTFSNCRCYCSMFHRMVLAFYLLSGIGLVFGFEAEGWITLKLRQGDDFVYETNEFRIAVEGCQWQLTTHRYSARYSNHVYATFGSTNNETIYSLFYGSQRGRYSAVVESNRFAFRNYPASEIVWRCLASPTFEGRYEEMLREYKRRNRHGYDWSNFTAKVEFFDRPSNLVKSALLFHPLGPEMTNDAILREKRIRPFQIPASGVLTGLSFTTLEYKDFDDIQIPTHCKWINYTPRSLGAFIPTMLEHIVAELYITNVQAHSLLTRFIPELPQTNVLVYDRRLTLPKGRGETVVYQVRDTQWKPAEALPKIKADQKRFLDGLRKKPPIASLIVLVVVVSGPAIYLMFKQRMRK